MRGLAALVIGAVVGVVVGLITVEGWALVALVAIVVMLWLVPLVLWLIDASRRQLASPLRMLITYVIAAAGAGLAIWLFKDDELALGIALVIVSCLPSLMLGRVVRYRAGERGADDLPGRSSAEPRH